MTECVKSHNLRCITVYCPQEHGEMGLLPGAFVVELQEA